MASDEATLKLIAAAVANSREAFMITEAEPLDEPGPRIIFVNPAFEELTGYSSGEILGLNPRILQGPKTDPAVRRRLREAMQPGGWSQVELVIYRKDGSEFEIELCVFPVRDERGRTTHFVSASHDITARRRRERGLAGQSRALELLTSGADLAQIAGALAESAASQTLGRDCVIHVIEAGGELRVLGVWPGLEPRPGCSGGAPIPACDDACAQAVRRGEPVFRSVPAVGLPTGLENATGPAPGEGSCWSFPIRGSGGVMRGVLSAIGRAPGSPTAEEDQALRDIANLAGIAIERRASEEALRASEQRLRTVLGAAPVVLWAMDRHGVFTLSEGRGLGTLGLAPGEVVGRSIFDLYQAHPDVIDHARRVLAGEPVVATVRLDRSAWEVRHVPLRAPDGSIDGAIGAATDVTERERAEEQRRRSEEQLRLITDEMPALIAYIDRDGRYRFMNRRYEDWHARPREELLGRHPRELLGEAAYAEIEAYLNAALGGEWVSYEKAFDFSGAGRRDVEVRYVPHQDAKGRTAGIFVLVLDISERREAERALRESERRMREMLEDVALAAVMVDRDGLVTFCNEFLLRLTGWRREDVIGRGWVERFVPPDQAERVNRAFADHQFGVPARPYVESEILTRDGRRRLIGWSNTVLRGPGGELIGATGLGVDITEARESSHELSRYRERLEALVAERTRALEASNEQLRQAERLAAIGTLAAGLGHDIANLMLPMRCRLDALEAAPLEPSLREEVAALRQSIEYLRQLCQGLRLYALDPSDPNASAGETDLIPWWKEAGRLVAKSVPAPIGLECDLPPGLPRVAVAQHQLTQAILNLVVNAVESMPGSGAIRVWAIHEQGSPSVRVGVTDDGPGMTPQAARHAMEPFFTTKKRGRSTGLGLSLVHSVAKSAGGSVRIESAPGNGTTVTMTLPAVSEGSRTRADGAAERTPSAAVSVGDDRMAALLRQVLRAAGFAAERRAPEDPGEADVWITDPTRTALGVARRFLAERAVRRVIVLGRPPVEWIDLGVASIDETRGLEGIREVLRLASGREERVGP